MRRYPVDAGDDIRAPGPTGAPGDSDAVQRYSFCYSESAAPEYASHESAMAVAIKSILPIPSKVHIVNSAIAACWTTEISMEVLQTGIDDVSVNAGAGVCVGERVVSIESGVLVDSIESPVGTELSSCQCELIIFFNIFNSRIAAERLRGRFRHLNRESFDCVRIDMSGCDSMFCNELLGYRFDFFARSFWLQHHDVLIANRFPDSVKLLRWSIALCLSLRVTAMQCNERYSR